MIPKKIHYCWFGGNPLPEKDKKCIESWKKFCPDYQIIRWDESNYDVNKNLYMQQAYNAKKWGFVPDFARLDIIYSEGGIYLDTDVEIIKSLNDLLDNEAFMGFESGEAVNPGLGFGAVCHHHAILELMNIYSERKFIGEDGSYDMTPNPILNTEKMKEFGCVINDRFQIVNGITVYPSDFFCPKDYVTGKLSLTENSHMIHHYNASWMTKAQKRRYVIRKFIGRQNYEFLVKMKRKFIHLYN